MSITNGYTTLAVVKAALRVTDTDDDTAIELAVESASRLIDSETGRRFFVDGAATARVFAARSTNWCPVTDIANATGLVIKTDTNGDGTFDTTWASTDYQLEPVNRLVDGQAWPYSSIRAVGNYTFPVSDETRVEVTADWGWSSVPKPVENACVIQAVSLFKAKDAPLGVAGFDGVGQTGVVVYAPSSPNVGFQVLSAGSGGCLMAGTVEECVDGAVTLIDAISGVRAFSDVPDNITPTTAIVTLDGVPDYHGAEQGGLPTYRLRVQLVVDALSNRTAYPKLYGFASYSGATSIRATIEADTTLGGNAQTCQVDQCENVGYIEIANVRYLAADFIITVYA